MTTGNLLFISFLTLLFALGLRRIVGDGLIRRDIAFGKSPSVRLKGSAAVAWGGFLTVLVVSVWCMVLWIFLHQPPPS
jgi:hypothetical protein